MIDHAMIEASGTAPLDGRMANHTLEVQRGAEGVLLVRVRADRPAQEPLPDAVFSFRIGDPQYSYWLERLLENEICQPAS